MGPLSRFALYFIATSNVILIAMVTIQTKYIAEHIVWDIDKVRNTHITEVSYWYRQGCITGTKYPPELKNISPNDWNPNSPPSWCEQSGRAYEEDFTNSAWKLGR